MDKKGIRIENENINKNVWDKAIEKIATLQNSTPFPKYVKRELEGLNSIDEKITFLKMCIERWQVNTTTYILMQDLTGWDKDVVEDSAKRHIKLYTAWLEYLEAMGNIQEEQQDNPDTEVKSESKRSMKVTTDVLVEMLKKMGINGANSDKTNIARLISYLTGYSENTIRQRLSNYEELTSVHKIEVDNINKILKELNSNISIKYNNNR